MSKPPKVIIPGLNRGAGIPPGYTLGRRRGTGKGPAELLDLAQMKGAGLATTAQVTQVVDQLSTALSTTTAAQAGAALMMGGEGEDGASGPPGQPGTAGTAGSPGATGPAGPPGFALDGLDGEEGMPIPGTSGAAGAAGAPGPQGPLGFGLDGQDGEEGMPIPGPAGLSGSAGSIGATGPQGPIGLGLDGLDGEEGMAIPGVPGPAGAPGAAGGWPAATVPGQIGGLIGWWDASLLAAPAGDMVATLNSPDPLRASNPASSSTSAVAVASSQINSRNAATFPLASTGSLVCTTGQVFNKSTAFVVHRPGTMTNTISYTYFSGLVNSLTFRLIGSGANVAKFELVKAQIASIGQSTVTVATATAFQGNYTYDGSTGAYAFRIAKAAAGSGTNLQGITASTTNLGVETTGLAAPLNGDLAELIIYARVLTPTEIAAVEAYLTAKWGV